MNAGPWTWGRPVTVLHSVAVSQSDGERSHPSLSVVAVSGMGASVAAPSSRSVDSPRWVSELNCEAPCMSSELSSFGTGASGSQRRNISVGQNWGDSHSPQGRGQVRSPQLCAAWAERVGVSRSPWASLSPQGHSLVPRLLEAGRQQKTPSPLQNESQGWASLPWICGMKQCPPPSPRGRKWGFKNFLWQDVFLIMTMTSTLYCGKQVT